MDGVVGVGVVDAPDGVPGQTLDLALARVDPVLEDGLLVQDADAADLVLVRQQDVELGDEERQGRLEISTSVTLSNISSEVSYIKVGYLDLLWSE